jgi:hypothetical protein
MDIIFDMASGKSPSPPVRDNTIAVHDEVIPALAMREPSPAGAEKQPLAHGIHLINALLKRV